VLRSSLLVETAARAGEQEARFVRLVSELSSEIQLGPLLQRIMAAVTRMLDADRSTLFLNDEKTGELFTEIGQGLGAQKIRFANDRGIAGASFTSGASINIPYAYADLRFNPAFDRQTGYFTRSLLCVPVVNKQAKVIGVTQVLNKRGGSFTDEDEARLRAFTAQIAIGLENAKLFDDVQAMKRYNERVLASMSSAVLTFDGALQLVSGNAAAARILGCELEPGAAAGDIFGEANAWLIERLQRAVESAQVDDAMDAAIQMASRSVAVNLSSMPLLGGQGEAMGAMLVFDDITEGKRIRSTMARYVDASVADRLLEDDADSLGGQSGVATTLFSDVRSFTPLSEMLGPQRTVALLNDYFTRMVACIEAEGGMLDKFVGDEIMAVFGVPYAHEDDPDRAIRTAIAMMRGLAIFNAEREATGDPSLSIGIGINTGEVFSGNIGAPRRMDFTVMGDGVNLASRLEGACKQYRAAVLFSEGTRRSLRGTYRSREVDRIRVIGRREPVVIHELLEHHDDASFPGMIDALAAFRDGLSLYRDARFEPAIQAFERALREHPDDGVSALYIERCQRLMATPPAEGWDGIWDLTEK
jgi:adenylate cyclase